MRKYFAAMWEGIVEGARETPRAFFSPLIEFARWTERVSDAGMAPPLAHYTLSPEAAKALRQAANKRGLSCVVALELAIHDFNEQQVTNRAGHSDSPNNQ